MQIGRVKDIFFKELSIEFRQKYAVGSVFLFAATIVYLVYKVFNNVTTLEWGIMLWIITLFAGLNAIVKSFVQEKRETYFYYYTLFDATELLVAKMLYNFVFLCFLFCAILGFMTLFIGFPVKDIALFFQGSFLGIFGLSVVFTFISLIASGEQANSTLMSVLAIPLVLPIMLLLLKITAVSLRLLQDTAIDQDLFMLFGIDVILLGAVILLFPALWRS